MQNVEEDKVRDLPGWPKDAPIPVCMGGDCRALAFCCKPGFSLTFGFKCMRDRMLAEVGITPKEFIKIKEEFSEANDWDSDITCFGSMSYCCMRRGGCPRRDLSLAQRYPGKTVDEIMEIYFAKKKELAKIILDRVEDPEKKEKIKPFLELLLE